MFWNHFIVNSSGKKSQPTFQSVDSCLFVTLVYEANSYNSELSSYFIMLPMRRVQHGRFWACALSNVLELSKWSVVGCLNGIRSQDRCVNSKTLYTCSPVRERKVLVAWQCVVLWNVLFRQQARQGSSLDRSCAAAAIFTGAVGGTWGSSSS